MNQVKSDELTAEQRGKESYVKYYLASTIGEATDYFIHDADYRAYTCGHEAVVLTVFDVRKKSGNLYREVPVNVTGDSLWAIVKDVVKTVERIYG